MDARILALVGPTCTGKSRLAAQVARTHGLAVLSADSMQVYRGMDIGTGKAFDDFGDVPTFGLDLADVNAPYSAALYQEYGRGVIAEQTAARGGIVVCGGTGFYVRALLDDMTFAPGEQEGNPVRDRYTRLAEEAGGLAVWQALHDLDPESAAAVHPNNVKRVIRALEMAQAGESYAARAQAFGAIRPYLPTCYVAVSLPRDELYRRIEARVDAMMARGLTEEVRGLLDAGLAPSATARQAIGYKEIIAYLQGECSMPEAVAAIKQATRRYAKRQLSWFGRDPRISWIDGMQPYRVQLACVEELWAKWPMGKEGAPDANSSEKA